MKYHIIVSDDVYSELRKLVEVVESERSGYGLRLTEAYIQAITLLTEFPFSHRIRKNDWRIIQISRFEYVLVYKVKLRNVVVARIVHARSGSKKMYRRK